MRNQPNGCPECEPDFPRRDFLRVAGALALVGTSSIPLWAGEKKTNAENFVQELYLTLNADQRKILCFPYEHNLRLKVSANWNITEPTIDKLEEKQQDLVEKVVRGLTSPEGYEKFEKQMGDDAGGLSEYHIAFFGVPGEGKFEFVLTGRHATMRADGNNRAGTAFGGPMVYGHAASGFTEKPDHTGNVFWYQAKRANEVFAALNPNQREQALVKQNAPRESNIQFTKQHRGLAVGAMSADQKKLVQQVMNDLLNPYRKEDADEVMDIITANGGLDKIHFAFYKNDEGGKNADLGNDGVWDIWRLEGPGFVWHFRGAPHVHTWVNIAKV